MKIMNNFKKFDSVTQLFNMIFQQNQRLFSQHKQF
ncbi:unnamed protein product [Paramecium pentaurelia]|uniref:Uncharacterized protein n=1 Tax=Paramecium pentaurelia TaxID=43138 RepID=A0A8S1T673_9CILI|nr:unnamed protein product [Paramecium pentaurelia]